MQGLRHVSRCSGIHIHTRFSFSGKEKHLYCHLRYTLRAVSWSLGMQALPCGAIHVALKVHLQGRKSKFTLVIQQLYAFFRETVPMFTKGWGRAGLRSSMYQSLIVFMQGWRFFVLTNLRWVGHPLLHLLLGFLLDFLLYPVNGPIKLFLNGLDGTVQVVFQVGKGAPAGAAVLHQRQHVTSKLLLCGSSGNKNHHRVISRERAIRIKIWSQWTVTSVPKRKTNYSTVAENCNRSWSTTPKALQIQVWMCVAGFDSAYPVKLTKRQTNHWRAKEFIFTCI